MSEDKENRPESALLDCPAEIRNEFFRPLVTFDEPLPVTYSESYDNTTFYKPPITETCAQIRGETLPVLYGVNIFEIRDPVKNPYSARARLVDGRDDVTKHVHRIVVYPNYPSKYLSFWVTRDRKTSTVTVISRYKYPPLFGQHTCVRDFTSVAAGLFRDEEPGLHDKRSLLEIADRIQHSECGGWAAEKLRCGKTDVCRNYKKSAFIKLKASRAMGFAMKD